MDLEGKTKKLAELQAQIDKLTTERDKLMASTGEEAPKAPPPPPTKPAA